MPSVGTAGPEGGEEPGGTVVLGTRRPGGHQRRPCLPPVAGRSATAPGSATTTSTRGVGASRRRAGRRDGVARGDRLREGGRRAVEADPDDPRRVRHEDRGRGRPGPADDAGDRHGRAGRGGREGARTDRRRAWRWAGRSSPMQGSRRPRRRMPPCVPALPTRAPPTLRSRRTPRTRRPRRAIRRPRPSASGWPWCRRPPRGRARRPAGRDGRHGGRGGEGGQVVSAPEPDPSGRGRRAGGPRDADAGDPHAVPGARRGAQRGDGGGGHAEADTVGGEDLERDPCAGAPDAPLHDGAGDRRKAGIGRGVDGAARDRSAPDPAARPHPPPTRPTARRRGAPGATRSAGASR